MKKRGFFSDIDRLICKKFLNKGTRNCVFVESPRMKLVNGISTCGKEGFITGFYRGGIENNIQDVVRIKCC
jgi:hypothetical protein